MLGVDVVERGVGDLVVDLLAGGGSGGIEVLLDLGLAVDPYAPAGQVHEVDVVTLLRPLQVDAAVLVAFATQPVTEPDRLQQLDGRVLEHAGPDPGGNVVSRAGLHDHGLDAVLREQVGQQKARGAGADDGDLSTHAGQSMPRVAAAPSHPFTQRNQVPRLRPTPCAATWRAATSLARSRLRLGTTMPSAATTCPLGARIGTATEHAPRLISSTVVA